ncbi:MAG: ABC transporter ATP-binding protein [Lachnospiraceae bacterium]|nr:ABC transporter ATP-binding protein [Lachnospiraceae bacterium]
MDNQIHVQDLSWKPSELKKPVLNHIQTSIIKGGFYGILGPNGSGKTSLLRHLLSYLPAEEGNICLGEKKLSDYSRKELAKKFAHVPQNTNVDASFSVYDIIMMGRSPYQKRFGGITKEDERKVSEAMELMHCEEMKEKLITRLSGGEAQRVIAARAIAQDTPYLFLDEPISHLDIRYQIELMEALKTLNEERGTTIIAVLHDINMAAKYCRQILLMKNGKVFADGKTEEVLNVKNLESVYEIPFFQSIHPLTNTPYFIPQ